MGNDLSSRRLRSPRLVLSLIVGPVRGMLGLFTSANSCLRWLFAPFHRPLRDRDRDATASPIGSQTTLSVIDTGDQRSAPRPGFALRQGAALRWVRPPAARSAASAAIVSVALLVVQSSAASASVGRAARTTTSSAALPAATPGWPQLHYGPDRTGYQPDETLVGTGNVGTLAQARTYVAGYGGMSAPLIANGVLYTDVAGYLVAFDAAGTSACSAAPTSCTPLWKAPTAYYDGMAVSDGKIFVTDAEGVQAFDATGTTNCSGDPKVCTPLWATTGYFTPGPGSPLVSDGMLYVPGYGDGLALDLGGAYVAAFDAAGTTNCSGTPTVCTPMWTTTGPPSSVGNVGSPALANGVLYIANGTLFAFDASGVTGCSGTAKVCAPLWTSTSITAPTYSAPAVSNGTVYVGSWYTGLYALDAAGSTNCSTTASVKTCTPLWTAPTSGGIGGTPAIAYGTVYTVSESGTLSAFDAAGSTNCSGTGTAKTCTPLWAAGPGGTGYVTSSSPAVANGVVYFSSTNGGTYAYDAAGSLNCVAGGAARTCTPLWGAVTGYIGGGSPALVNGVVYINLTANGAIYAYTGSPTPPPPPPTPPVPVVTAAPVLTGGPLVSGTPRVGHTLTCQASYAGATSVVYHWKRNGVTVGGARATYALKAADRKTHVRCTSQASNLAGLSAVSTSRTLTIGLGAPLVKHKAPSISGRAKVASTVRAKVGSWSPAATSYSYQWLLGGKAIRHATHSSFTIPKGDKGKRLSLKVTAHRAGFANGSAISRPIKIT
jgi:hypothetical protein